ncbi:DUF1428 family protein [Pseudogemmobacter sonorensis]|uniref:DUF1428 family protein n=1 Tax=Pseudogemmobacter sonorensis TaxID=2989681 RepID=UPI0036B3D187
MIFLWMTWPDKATRDAAFSRLEALAATQDMSEMPFDGARMVFGGFTPLIMAS